MTSPLTYRRKEERRGGWMRGEWRRGHSRVFRLYNIKSLVTHPSFGFACFHQMHFGCSFCCETCETAPPAGKHVSPQTPLKRWHGSLTVYKIRMHKIGRYAWYINVYSLWGLSCILFKLPWQLHLWWGSHGSWVTSFKFHHHNQILICQ